MKPAHRAFPRPTPPRAALFALLAGAGGLLAQGISMVKPMQPTEIAQELKSGFSPGDVAQDVRQHRLARAPSAAELKAMQQAGASAELLALAQSPAIIAPAEAVSTAPVPKVSPPARPAFGGRFWIFGLIASKPPDGGALVACKNVQPDSRDSDLPRAGDEYVHFAKMPPSTKTEDGEALVNCEAVLVGKTPMRKRDGSRVDVPDLELVRDLAPAATPGQSAPLPQPPKAQARQVVIAQDGWHDLRALGGPAAGMKLLGIDFDSIRVRFSTWPATRVVPIERGREARTVIYEDGKGGSVAYIDSISRPDNSGVFELVAAPSAPAP